MAMNDVSLRFSISKDAEAHGFNSFLMPYIDITIYSFPWYISFPDVISLICQEDEMADFELFLSDDMEPDRCD